MYKPNESVIHVIAIILHIFQYIKNSDDDLIELYIFNLYYKYFIFVLLHIILIKLCS